MIGWRGFSMNQVQNGMNRAAVRSGWLFVAR